MRLEDLNKAKLLEAAEFYGVDVPDGAHNKDILVALVESGVDNALYTKDFGKPEEGTVTSSDVNPDKEEEENLNLEDVAEPEVETFETQQKYLIKMERKNPLFEFGKFRFTQERPFAVMPAEEAEKLLRSETGFRQAFPSEAEDFFS